jgi:hypothetical protein
MKVGDRVWFAYAGADLSQQGFGRIIRIYHTPNTSYDVVKDGDTNDGYPFYIEPEWDDVIVPEQLYKSKLYKVLA